MKPINQHIPVMMTLTFIHVRSTQCACVSKLNTDVMITNHSLVDQRYGPDVSNYISSVITNMAPLCNPRQRDSWRGLTLYHTDPLCIPRQRDRPWEGIGYGDISYKGARDLLSLINQTLSPKSLIKSVEIPNFISYSLGDLTQSAKTLCKEKSSEDTLNLALYIGSSFA